MDKIIDSRKERINSIFSEQYFDNILSCIDNIEVEELEDTIKTQMSFVMVNTIEKIYNEAISYLKKSIKIEPNFIDNYYNIAIFYLYTYLLGNKKDKKYIEKSKKMLRTAENINPQSRKTLLIKKIVYEMA